MEEGRCCCEMEDGLLSCNAIGNVGKLGEVGLVKGMIHAYDCIGSKAFEANGDRLFLPHQLSLVLRNIC